MRRGGAAVKRGVATLPVILVILLGGGRGRHGLVRGHGPQQPGDRLLARKYLTRVGSYLYRNVVDLDRQTPAGAGRIAGKRTHIPCSFGTRSHSRAPWRLSCR